LFFSCFAISHTFSSINLFHSSRYHHSLCYNFLVFRHEGLFRSNETIFRRRPKINMSHYCLFLKQSVIMGFTLCLSAREPSMHIGTEYSIAFSYNSICPKGSSCASPREMLKTPSPLSLRVRQKNYQVVISRGVKGVTEFKV
jgi:hypothetical protein